MIRNDEGHELFLSGDLTEPTEVMAGLFRYFHCARASLTTGLVTPWITVTRSK